MPSVFSVKEINHKGERLSQKDIDRLIQKGFKKVEGGFIINLYDLGKKEKRRVSNQATEYHKLNKKEVMNLTEKELQL